MFPKPDMASTPSPCWSCGPGAINLSDGSSTMSPANRCQANVRRQRRVELHLALLDEPHDQGRREGLRDTRDGEFVLGRGLPTVRSSDSGGAGPRPIRGDDGGDRIWRTLAHGRFKDGPQGIRMLRGRHPITGPGAHRLQRPAFVDVPGAKAAARLSRSAEPEASVRSASGSPRRRSRRRRGPDPAGSLREGRRPREGPRAPGPGTAVPPSGWDPRA
jgi:hypothetical protein